MRKDPRKRLYLRYQIRSSEFIKNPDIAAEFGKVKSGTQLSIGFALETDKLITNGTTKLHGKNFNAIVLNSPGKDEGFGHDTNRISILRDDLTLNSYPLKSKIKLATDIVNEIEQLYAGKFS